MAETIKEERLRWVGPIVDREVRLVDVASVCPYGKRTLERWVAAYRRGGSAALEPRSTEPATQPNETPLWIKERIVSVRKNTGKCALKIHWQLAKAGLIVPPRTIGKILKQAGLVRRYRVKRVKYRYLRAERQPGELVEIDVKYVPGPVADKQYFQYTAIDTASRWRYLAIADDQATYLAIRFLEDVRSRFPYPIRAVKTDNHTTFTNYYAGTNKRSDRTVKTVHPLDQYCARAGIVHYLIDAGKPAQNGTVERSHREDQEKFYERRAFRSVWDLRAKLRQWNTDYNNLEHCGLGGKTPNEFLTDYQLTNPPNVPA